MAVTMVLCGFFAARLGKPDHRSRRVHESPVTAFAFTRDLHHGITRAHDSRPGQQEGDFFGWEAAEGTQWLANVPEC